MMELDSKLEKQEKRKMMISKANERLGETNYNRLGSKMWIIRYGNARDIDVEFENGYVKKNTHYSLFKSGAIVNPYDISVYGHGYIGEGKYKPSVKGKHTPEYTTWKSMLTRCYSKNYHKKQPSYIGCTVHEDWLNFQTFSKWYESNYYFISNEKLELDKDILVKGNKVYSPNTCVFVPKKINRLFTKTNKSRGKLPIGVIKNGNKYNAYCNDGSKNTIHLGSFNTYEEAFDSYKKCKERIIHKVANDYRQFIPTILYDALLDYTVDITD